MVDTDQSHGGETILTARALAQLRIAAGILLPGDGDSPSAADVTDLDGLLVSAVTAIGREAETLYQCLDLLPESPDWDALRLVAQRNPEEFEVLSAVVAGAYFMSPVVLDSIGYPRGERRPAPYDQIVDELESGVLNPVIARESMVREVTP